MTFHQLFQENPNLTAFDHIRPRKTYSKISRLEMFNLNHSRISLFFEFVGTDSAQFQTAGCSWLHWRHSSGSSSQSADYLVDQLQILSGPADFTCWSKVLRQFIRNSTFIQWLKKYQFYPESFLIEQGFWSVQKIPTAKAKSSQVPKYSEFLERATVYIFISTVLRGRPGRCQDTLYNRIVPRHSAISGLGFKYSRNWTF